MRWINAVVALAACTPAPGTPLETWGGVAAFAFGDKRAPVYARSATEAGFEPGGIETDAHGFQCVELAVRYLYFEHGIADAWSGDDAWQMCATHPTGVEVVATPEVGDLVVFPANEPTYDIGPDGHVAIVRARADDGTLAVFQQHWGDESTAFADGIDPSVASCFLRATSAGRSSGSSAAAAASLP